jgi:gliding motility-associated protein GldC
LKNEKAQYFLLLLPLCKNQFAKMHTSNIFIDVVLDDNKVPETITWKASESTADAVQKAKAMMIAFWDSADKSALRIDLWTKDMMVDEMADFFYQTLMTMADTYNRATKQQELTDDMKKFAKDFYNKFRELQMKENK